MLKDRIDMIVALETRTAAWHHFQARFAEWMNTVVLIGFGTYLILHPGMFDDPRVSALWVGLKAAAPQETWGLMSLLIGMARGGALWINGRHTRTPMVRLIACFFSAFILTQIVLGLWKAGVPNTGVIIYPVLILADLYSAFRASSDMTFVARQEQAEQAAETGRVSKLHSVKSA
jgi:hypothetical protein